MPDIPDSIRPQQGKYAIVLQARCAILSWETNLIYMYMYMQ